MLDRLRNLFSSAKPSLPDESRAFIEKLAPSSVWILAIGIRGTPAISPVWNPKTLETIAAHRIELDAIGDDDSVFPFNHQDGGQQVFPFFSSKEFALKFIEGKNISYFQPYSLLSGFVATPENEMFALVLDPTFPSEHKFTHGERLLLRSLSRPVQ